MVLLPMSVSSRDAIEFTHFVGFRGLMMTVWVRLNARSMMMRAAPTD